MTQQRLRSARLADLPRTHEVRHGTADNRLPDSTLVTEAEVAWYMDVAMFLVCEDETSVQGFACVNHQTGYVWALFVIDEAQGRGQATPQRASLQVMRQAIETAGVELIAKNGGGAGVRLRKAK
jgi:hypothetical protein